MIIRWIGNRHANLDKESQYLTKMYHKGYVLKKVGALFYHFNQVEPQIGSVDIDVNQSTTISHDGWEHIATRKLIFSQSRKQYFKTNDKDKQIRRNAKEEINYYETVFNQLFGLLILSILVFVTVLNLSRLLTMPDIFFLANFVLIVPILFSIITIVKYEKSYRKVLKENNITPIEDKCFIYMIKINDYDEDKLAQFEKELCHVGPASLVTPNTFRVRSSESKEVVKQYVLSKLPILDNQIEIVSPMELLTVPF